jgi:hypothetical protein
MNHNMELQKSSELLHYHFGQLVMSRDALGRSVLAENHDVVNY